ncbi:MAG TPA: adenylate/guanylate cyclase domain-containing protein, partial [Mycobacteriales bacterium]|nr:adenylate/guanylate cyclase domain-containing protein [Mycobacteriales bacterium]
MDTVVLVLTDVQGSTRLWQDEPAAMDAAMVRHHEIIHGAVAEHDGWRPADQGEGDSVFAAFHSATAAVAAVAQIQRGLAAEPWPTSTPIRVRIGVHLGEVTERDGNLYGEPVNRCARLRSLGTGGQTLMSASVFEVVRDNLPAGTELTDLGEHRMRDLTRAEHVWQLDFPDLPQDFPALASLERALHNLPVQPSPLIGRATDLASVLGALRAHRLVTLTGFGGMGKTRLALQAAAELAVGDADGVWFVDLAGVTDPSAVPSLIGRATGLGGSDADSVIEAMTGQRLLLVLDNLEQVLGCAPFIAEMLARVPGVAVLATSRQPLRLRGEQEIPLTPLALPPLSGPQDAATLTRYAAVELFVERAMLVRPDFRVTDDNAPAVAAICQRLDGLPLAIELAAARVRMMTPQALLDRLDQALTVLTGGGRDMPGRHQTLRATIVWSYDLLEPGEKLLLDRVSVFSGPVAYEHVEAVCGETLDVFPALASLVEKSLVRTSLSEGGEYRYSLLASIEAFAREQLTAGGADTALKDRHADHMIGEAAYRAPFTAQDWLDRKDRVAQLFDELTAAWQHVQQRPGDPRVRRFPIAYFRELFTRTQDGTGIDQFIAHHTTATAELLEALALRIEA